MPILEEVCKQLGIPLALHKKDGPTTCIVFLGIEIDSVHGELRLPAEKMERLQSLLESWGDKKTCTRRELQSLVGLLNHACKVVKPGRSFLRRMIALVHQGNHSIIRLNRDFRADLAWWREFVSQWNGVSFLHPPDHWLTVEIASDASGSWGCGAWYNQSWFQLEWDSHSDALDITGKELIPIILACVAWGHAWSGHRVICHCDNQAVVACLRSRSSRQPMLMHMLRCLVFIEAHVKCHIQSIYINTKLNHVADDLSRNNISSFFSKVPHADPRPSRISRRLLEPLLNPKADWISAQWRRQFRDIFRVA